MFARTQSVAHVCTNISTHACTHAHTHARTHTNTRIAFMPNSKRFHTLWHANMAHTISLHALMHTMIVIIFWKKKNQPTMIMVDMSVSIYDSHTHIYLSMDRVDRAYRCRPLRCNNRTYYICHDAMISKLTSIAASTTPGLTDSDVQSAF